MEHITFKALKARSDMARFLNLVNEWQLRATNDLHVFTELCVIKYRNVTSS